MRKKHLIGLDIARFCAALAVVFYHLGALYLIDPSRPFMARIIDTELIGAIAMSWSKYGWIGVQVFFVISGIVIAESIDGKTTWNYVRSRFLRLYPGVWVCTAISMGCIIATHQAPSEQWMALWLRSSSIFPLGPWVDGAYWTLPVEMIFYALMLACIGRSPRASIIVAWGLCLMSASFWALYTFGPEQASISQWTRKVAGTFRFDAAFVQYGIYFGLGIFISRANRIGKALAAVALCAPICAVQIAKIAHHATDYMNVPVSGWIPFVTWLLAVTTIIVTIHKNDAITGLIGERVIRMVRNCGLATYPLYLLHVTVGFAAISVGMSAGLDSLVSWSIGLAVPVWLSFYVATNLEPKVRDATKLVIDKLRETQLQRPASKSG